MTTHSQYTGDAGFLPGVSGFSAGYSSPYSYGSPALTRFGQTTLNPLNPQQHLLAQQQAQLLGLLQREALIREQREMQQYALQQAFLAAMANVANSSLAGRTAPSGLEGYTSPKYSEGFSASSFGQSTDGFGSPSFSLSPTSYTSPSGYSSPTLSQPTSPVSAMSSSPMASPMLTQRTMVPNAADFVPAPNSYHTGAPERRLSNTGLSEYKHQEFASPFLTRHMVTNKVADIPDLAVRNAEIWRDRPAAPKVTTVRPPYERLPEAASECPAGDHLQPSPSVDAVEDLEDDDNGPWSGSGSPVGSPSTPHRLAPPGSPRRGTAAKPIVPMETDTKQSVLSWSTVNCAATDTFRSAFLRL